MFVTRQRIAMLTAEFMGTAMLTLTVLAISRSQIGFPFFVSLGVGLLLAMMILTIGLASGAHFNPAVTLGLWTIRRVSALKTITYIAAQLLGAVAAYLLFSYLTGSTWENSDNGFQAKILIAEALGTAILAMGIATVVFNKLEGAKAAFTIGASLTIGVLLAAIASNGLLNPAVALGVRSWVVGTYVLGPILGAIIGFNLYALLFAPPKNIKIKD